MQITKKKKKTVLTQIPKKTGEKRSSVYRASLINLCASTNHLGWAFKALGSLACPLIKKGQLARHQSHEEVYPLMKRYTNPNWIQYFQFISQETIII
jgi:hypothetical protein